MNQTGPLPKPDAMRGVARCFARSWVMLARGEVHMPPDHLGRTIAFADGSAARVYRETRALWFGGHYWAEPVGPGITTMTLEVDKRGLAPKSPGAVETVGRYCSIDSGVGVRFVGARWVAGSWQVQVSPLLDEDAQDRFVGCLEDAVLEWHRFTVTDTTLTPRNR
ncbi:hypothetical protein [Nocardioides pakistanensis]